MSCPYCNQPEEYFTGEVVVINVEWPNASIDFACECDNCGKTFWQRHYFKTEDYLYDNISNEQHDKDVKEME